MKRVLIQYSYIMKNGIEGTGRVYATINTGDSEEETKREARRDFYNEHGFNNCFDVLELEVTSVVTEE